MLGWAYLLMLLGYLYYLAIFFATFVAAAVVYFLFIFVRGIYRLLTKENDR